MTREEKRGHWQGLVTCWQASGLSQVAWCRQKGVAVASLRQWVAKLNEPETASAGFLRVELHEEALAVASIDRLELLRGAWRLSVPLSASEAEILKVLRAVAQVEAR